VTKTAPSFGLTQNLLIGALALYLFGITAYGISPLKYIGLYSALALYLLLWSTSSKAMIDIYQDSFRNNKILLTLLILFLCTTLISALLGYAGAVENLRDFRRSFLNIGIFLVIVLGIKEKKKLATTFFSTLVLALISNTLYLAFHFFQHTPEVYENGHINRFFSFHYDYLVPFGVVMLFLIRSLFLRALLIFLLAAGLVEMFLTGARGAWISIAFSLFILAVFAYYRFKNYRKYILYGLGGALVTLAIAFAGVYRTSAWVQKKFHEGVLYPNGRDTIVKERLPIFLKYGNHLYGIGGPGNSSYHKFLNDHHAPHHYGTYEHGTFRYFSDEPFLLQIFYKLGTIGLVGFISLFILIAVNLLRVVFNPQTPFALSLFSMAIFASFVSYFLVRGLVEGRELGYLLFYLALYFTLPKPSRRNL